MTLIPLPRTPLATVQGTLALELVFDDPAPMLDGSATATGNIEPWAQRVIQAAVEVVGGHRPVSQLVRWLTPDVYRDLQRRALLVARSAGPEPAMRRRLPIRPQVRSVHASYPAAGVAECSARIRYGERSRALAGRFEQRDGRWLLTALDWA